MGCPENIACGFGASLRSFSFFYYLELFWDGHKSLTNFLSLFSKILLKDSHSFCLRVGGIGGGGGMYNKLDGSNGHGVLGGTHTNLSIGKGNLRVSWGNQSDSIAVT